MSKSKKDSPPEERRPEAASASGPEENVTIETESTSPEGVSAPDSTQGGEPSAPSEGESSPLLEMEMALKAEREKYLRLAAEFDNYRKRVVKERETLQGEITSDLVARFLPIYDSLSRALSQGSTDEAFFKGIEMTMAQLKDILAKLGVVEIPAVGQPFDPERHNAVMHVEDPSLGQGVVVEEFEKGFMLGDRVIRFSMVKVAN